MNSILSRYQLLDIRKTPCAGKELRARRCGGRTGVIESPAGSGLPQLSKHCEAPRECDSRRGQTIEVDSRRNAGAAIVDAVPIVAIAAGLERSLLEGANATSASIEQRE